MKVLNYFLLVVLIVIFSCKPSIRETGVVHILPQPAEIQVDPGFFTFDHETRLVVPPGHESLNEAIVLQASLKNVAGFEPPITNSAAAKNAVVFEYDPAGPHGNEGYEMEVSEKRILIKAAADAGFFYAVQSLLQMLPPQIFGSGTAEAKWKIPLVHLKDKPRFPWRGMHLDVSRHFFSVDFVKKYIDLIAMHKMNKFHWHLTDDNGWRIEIKKYPKLTGVSAWRVDRTHEPWREAAPPQPGEKPTYGGFYTQDEIREVVAYAAQRHVEVIPEIEMPGHTSEVFAAYPELSCTGEKLYVQPASYWPNVDIFCAGKEETFVFIEDVLTEVMDLFPSQYVHIGGDEATKDRWETCPLCQKRMETQGLANEHELQSWFVKRVEKFLTAHGKKLIGWDEILEGGLAPDATVMSWRGFQGGIDAARQGHDVVMCPTAYCYFDYYQANPNYEPEAIGGLTTLKTVYSFEPIPADLDASQAKHILGAQGNLWTEYVQTPEHAQYMSLPRMTALAEVVWSPVDARNWNHFRERLQTQFARFQNMGVNFSTGSWQVNIVPVWDEGTYKIALETEQLNPAIHFTLDGSMPSNESPLYSAPFTIDSSVTLQAAIFNHGQLVRQAALKQIVFHQATGLRGALKSQPNDNYKSKGAASLTDGLRGSDNFRDGYWLGFQGEDMDFEMQFEPPVLLSSITLSFLQNAGAWILLPPSVDVEVLNQKGEIVASRQLVSESYPEVVGTLVEDFVADFKATEAYTVRIHASNVKTLPEWHPNHGNKAWIFIDEIVFSGNPPKI